MSFRKSQAESREATGAPKASDDYRRLYFIHFSPDLRSILLMSFPPPRWSYKTQHFKALLQTLLSGFPALSCGPMATYTT